MAQKTPISMCGYGQATGLANASNQAALAVVIVSIFVLVFW